LALNRGECQVFNIGRGIQVSDAEMFETIRRAVGIANQPRFAPHRRGEVQHICLDSSSASRVFGWEPEVGLSEGIGKTIAHIRSEFRGDATMKSLAVLEASQPLFQGRTP
jgi:UDP-glucose 4-epimerase